MTIPKCSRQCLRKVICWYPLLPSFSARIMFGLRSLLGIACCAALALSPVTSKLIQGQLLLGLGFIVAMQNTLGATIQASSRLFLGGFIAAIYCLLVVTYLPKDIYYAVGATNLFVLVMVYTDLPATVRRFSILPTCVILLQWFNKPHVNTSYVLHTWASLSIGGALAIISSCVPLPVLPTAYRELIIRMKFVSRQIRREAKALVSLISEYHNVHLHFDKGETNTNDGIDMPRNSLREDDLYSNSQSYENLKDDHLLRSDIEDLHTFLNEELKQLTRALNEISFEPYFIFLKLINLSRKLCRHIPFIKRFINKPSMLRLRLEIWGTCLVSLQRTITGMLSLDYRPHAFEGQRQLVDAIRALIDAIFDFLDAALPYTTSTTTRFKAEQMIICREKVEAALENFLETYAQIREESNYLRLSNTDTIRLNTFLLLILRLVHVTITSAENSETPGTCIDIGTATESVRNISDLKKSTNLKKILISLVSYIGLQPSLGKLIRAVKTSLSVLVSAIIALILRQRLQTDSWVYWAPMTTALVSDSSEGGTLRLSFQRLVAVLIGSTYAYIIVLVAQSRLAIGICVSLFVALMGYIGTDSQKHYFAVVCGQSASIITFLSNQEGFEGSRKAVLARTSLTFLGIFIHVFISNIFLPISARRLTRKRVVTMIDNVSNALKSACHDFCLFFESSIPSSSPSPSPSATNSASIDQQTASSNAISFDLLDVLAETELKIDSFPALLEEAQAEPNFWKCSFVDVKDRYADISKTLRRIIRNIRFIHRCTTILQAEAKLHLALEAKWQIRRASVTPNHMTDGKNRSSWTISELRKQKHVQNDLDVPLSIFVRHAKHGSRAMEKKSLIHNHSSASLRVTNTKSYEPVLEHIRRLELAIQQVLLKARQLIDESTMNSMGSPTVKKLNHDDSFNEQSKDNLRDNATIHPPSFYSANQESNSSFNCDCRNQENSSQPLLSLRDVVDLMLAAFVQFLYANNHFIRQELVSIQSIGDILAFHTLSYSLKDMVEATTDLAKSARRIKRINIRTLVRDIH